MFISSNELSYSRHFGSSSSVSYREPTIDFVLGGDSSSACYRELTNTFALFTYRMECKRHLSSLTPHYNANTFARISCVLSMCAYRPKYPVFLSIIRAPNWSGICPRSAVRGRQTSFFIIPQAHPSTAYLLWRVAHALWQLYPSTRNSSFTFALLCS